MTIYHPKKRTADIPLVPMLDILAILLIFFIVHTELKRPLNVLQLALPQTRHLEGEEGNPNALVLEIGEDGSLALGGKKLTMAELTEALERTLRRTPQAAVQLSADEGASTGRLVEVIDKLAEAGLKAEDIPIRILHAEN